MRAAPTPLNALLTAALAGSALLACSQASATNIRVLVASGAAVSVQVPIGVSLAQSGAVQGAASGGVHDWSVTADGSALRLNAQPYPGDTLYLPPVAGSSVQIAGRTYRGGVLLRASKGSVSAVNVVDLEDYLRGVVPAEMPSSWPLEALKAQAVVARTYAAARINPASYYDLCATETCQVYGGVGRETVQADAAIAATRAQVVSYAGAAARTYFSSDSGGHTASSQEAWGQSLPYLSARPDPASQGPNSRWTLTLPLGRITEVASRYGVRVGALRSLNIVGVSPSGRATAITFTGALGTDTLRGAEAGGFLRALGAKSSRVNVSGSDPLTITGAGAGHGVGLSQWGAAGWARSGWNHLQIMGFYYAGASISSILGAELPGGRLSTGVALGQVAAPLLGQGAPPLPKLSAPLPAVPTLAAPFSFISPLLAAFPPLPGV